MTFLFKSLLDVLGESLYRVFTLLISFRLITSCYYYSTGSENDTVVGYLKKAYVFYYLILLLLL